MNSEASPPAETTEELSRLKQRIRELERAEVEHRRTEEALRQSEERYRTFFEQAAVGVAEIEHVTGRFLTANQRLCELLGRTEQELQATTFQAITHPEDLHLHEEKSEQLLAGAIDHYALEKRYLAKNGAPVWVNITVSHPHGMDFPCRRNIVVVEDITERKQAEEALLAQGNKMASIFRAAPVGIGTVIHRVLQEANDMLCLMTGYSREELVGQSARMLYPTQEDYDYVGKEKYRQIGEKSTGTVETRWLRKDGAVIDILLSSTPLVPQDLARGVTFTALDITDRKRAERELLEMQNKLHHAQKLESLGTLAGGVAHDFNNLLMGIQGYASLALLDQDPTHPNYERLKRIEEQVKSGADLTRQLLGFARGGRYEVVPTDMNDILDKTASLFCRTKKEISLLRKYAADLRPVDVDRGQMEQVLLNLYVNAWQAMPQGGEIYLETATVPSSRAPT
jgi:PAS domain S-box-containing protein